MMNHAVEYIILKKANIDIDIIPIVQWLNGFHTTFTIWSCQGDENIVENTDYFLPYVNFVCGDLEEIKTIKNTIEKARSQGVSFGCNTYYEDNIAVIQYYIYFERKDGITKLLDIIKNAKELNES